MSDQLFRNDDRRREQRVQAKVEVRFTAVKDAARALNAFSINFSAGGLCLRTKTPRTLGERLQLGLTIDGQQFDLAGTVAWIKGDAIGVRFEEVGPKDRDRLERVARSLAKSAPAS
ncbi:MAG: PilZ domain-containing protein [Myxococcaceae bacterium]|nr:PilZ domain-containing protein [Myxococcaceae bacterium]